jgi:hypothetical protein
MAPPLRALILFLALGALIDVATPPVIENHLEIGFCSADCPVQHAAAGAAVAPPPPPRVVDRLAATVAAVAFGFDIATSAAEAPDVPRAPPSA